MKLDLEMNKLVVRQPPKDLAVKAALIPGVQLERDGHTVYGSNHGLYALVALLENRPLRPIDGAYAWEPLVMDPPLHPFQMKGVSFLKSRLEQGVFLNDDVGLGKTVQAVVACAGAKEHVKVVLCPAFLRHQWAGEIQQWAPGATVTTLIPKSQRRKKDAEQPQVGRGSWVVGYYDDASTALDLVYRQHHPYLLVVDEAHRLRGRSTKRNNEVKGLANFAAGRVGLSASPLYTDVARMHTALDIIEPGGWGSYYGFAARYMDGRRGEWGFEVGDTPTHVEEMSARLSYMSLRRTMETVGKELPYSACYQVTWLEGVPPSPSRPGAKGWGQYLSQLAYAKYDAVQDAVDADGLPCLVFTYLREHAELLAKTINGALLLHGGWPATQRMKVLDKYIKSCGPTTRPIVVGTMDSIGEGLNLQWAKAVYFAALDDHPEKVRQCVGRAVRMGQLGKVPVKFFALRRSYDEVYIDKLVKGLGESQALQGVESDKASLADALQPKIVEDQLKEMYDRYIREEARNQ